MNKEELIPRVCVVKAIRQETSDVKTFMVVDQDGKKPFEHIPGQCAMLSIPGLGESMISITSSPTLEDHLEFSIKKVGVVTSFLHAIEPGQEILLRGPYGNGFPVDTKFKGKDLLFIAGGIGVAPLHSVINYCRAHRSDYGKLTVIYGSRTKEDLVDLQEMQEEWMKDDMDVYLTIDREEEGWDGHVGFVPNYVTELNLPPTMTACRTPGSRAISCSRSPSSMERRENTAGRSYPGTGGAALRQPTAIISRSHRSSNSRPESRSRTVTVFRAASTRSTSCRRWVSMPISRNFSGVRAISFWGSSFQPPI